ncbi:50S ribosomal protein L32e [archaeon SCG-AAA382B04]|nr:50S ribosomal protein L32e [archaeon SCG-AAA382B04]
MAKKFKRQNSQRYKKIKSTWRRPKGIQSKQRKEEKGKPAKPKVGRKQPEEQRGFHPSGYKEQLVHNTSDLAEINEENQAIRIASKVGKRKRIKVEQKAREKNIKILNEKYRGEQSD